VDSREIDVSSRFRIMDRDKHRRQHLDKQTTPRESRAAPGTEEVVGRVCVSGGRTSITTASPGRDIDLALRWRQTARCQYQATRRTGPRKQDSARVDAQDGHTSTAVRGCSSPSTRRETWQISNQILCPVHHGSTWARPILCRSWLDLVENAL
jgi:hypothetical protein